jgi:HAD superfamily hydrolase (TIGR01509 family)
LGLTPLPPPAGIVDCRDVNLVTKHDPSSFQLAMDRAGASDPSRCLLLDDSVPNIRTAKSLGLKTCIVRARSAGMEGRS